MTPITIGHENGGTVKVVAADGAGRRGARSVRFAGRWRGGAGDGARSEEVSGSRIKKWAQPGSRDNLLPGCQDRDIDRGMTSPSTQGEISPRATPRFHITHTSSRRFSLKPSRNCSRKPTSHWLSAMNWAKMRPRGLWKKRSNARTRATKFFRAEPVSGVATTICLRDRSVQRDEAPVWPLLINRRLAHPRARGHGIRRLYF